MKKLLASLLVLALAVSLAGAALANTPVKIGASPSPHAQILEFLKAKLAEKGFDLEVVVFTDYIMPNTATEDGQLDANYFQHLLYLNDFNASNGTHLVTAIAMHFEPMGIYPGGKASASLADIQDGAKIAVPNDPTNEARALLLLEAQGLIKIAEGKGTAATKLDIVENPHNLDFYELEAAQVPLALPDVAFAVINGNYALDSGLSAVTDSVAYESPDTINPGYVNYIVVKEGNESAPFIEALKEVLDTEEARAFITDTYEGAVIAAF